MKINEIIQKLAGVESLEIYSQICVVKSVDSTKRTCVCSPVNGDSDLHGVLLQAVDSGTAGIVITPKVNSFVVVTFISKELAYIALTAECDKIEVMSGEIIFNDGSKGGLAVVSSIAEKLNILEQRMLTHQHLCASPGSPTVVDPATNPTISQTQASELENTAIKHG